MRVSIVIPTLNGARHLPALCLALGRQTLLPAEIIVVDSSSADDTATVATALGCKVEVIPREQFRHGATRNHAASLASGEILVFMTQDALPASETFLESLVRPIAAGEAVGCFARQVAHADAPPPEAFARAFNYPDRERTNTLESAQAAGVRGFFFSNVSSAVRAESFWSVGGFRRDVIVNEDMILARDLMQAGGHVTYAADAVVTHSHHYRFRQQLTRYFDIGVFLASTKDEFPEMRARSEGGAYVRSLFKHLAAKRQWRWLAHSVVDCGVRAVGHQLGVWHRFLPRRVKRRVSGVVSFWA